MEDDFPGEFPEVKTEPEPQRANAGYFTCCLHCKGYLFSATRLPVLYKSAAEIKPFKAKRKFVRATPPSPQATQPLAHPEQEQDDPVPKKSKGIKRKKPKMA